ncbi:MAG: hypothetical protein ABSE49_07690 [Polyangiaceae bacterium]|jgi:hypothetical protein
MRRKITIALLALGTVVGYGSTLAHAVHHHRHADCAGWSSHPGPSGENTDR